MKTHKTILVVEDDVSIAEVIQDVLRNKDREFLVADSLDQAGRFLRRSMVDLIILDRILPDGDGVSLLKTIKTDPALRRIPVLILSGKVKARDQVDGLDLGADDYIGKPFIPSELRARAEALMRRARKFVSPGP